LEKALRWPFRTPGRRVSTNSPRTPQRRPDRMVTDKVGAEGLISAPLPFQGVSAVSLLSTSL
jgi:hypothetical protein